MLSYIMLLFLDSCLTLCFYNYITHLPMIVGPIGLTSMKGCTFSCELLIGCAF